MNCRPEINVEAFAHADQSLRVYVHGSPAPTGTCVKAIFYIPQSGQAMHEQCHIMAEYAGSRSNTPYSQAYLMAILRGHLPRVALSVSHSSHAAVPAYPLLLLPDMMSNEHMHDDVHHVRQCMQ